MEKKLIFQSVNKQIDIIINEKDENLRKKIKKNNHDIFDENDKFYNDYCSIYNEDNLDIILQDRRDKFYVKSINNIHKL